MARLADVRVGPQVDVELDQLTGVALDWAMALAEGLPLCGEAYQVDYILVGYGNGDLRPYRPSTDWDQGGPLMEKHIIELSACALGDAGFYARHREKPCDGDQQFGETALIATCRAIVFAKLGNVISVPVEVTHE